jgi:hypothetical protein
MDRHGAAMLIPCLSSRASARLRRRDGPSIIRNPPSFIGGQLAREGSAETGPKWRVVSEPFACCVHAVERLPVRPGDRVLVIGAGPVGLLLTNLKDADPTLQTLGNPSWQRIPKSECCWEATSERVRDHHPICRRHGDFAGERVCPDCSHASLCKKARSAFILSRRVPGVEVCFWVRSP